MKNWSFVSHRVQMFFLIAICGLIPLMLTIDVLKHNAKYFVEDGLETEIAEIGMLAANYANVQTAYSTLPLDIDLLQIYANEISKRTSSDAYVIYLDNDNTVLTHPDRSQVGSILSLEHQATALEGGIHVFRTEGYAGPTIRCIVPIFVNDHQVGAVVVALLEPDIEILLAQMYRSILIVSLLMIGLVTLVIINSVLKNLIGLVVVREGILHSVNEGIIATNDNLVITMINQAAQELFPVGTNFEGEKVTLLIPDSPLVNVVVSQKPEYNKQLLINGNNVLSNSFPLFFDKKMAGAVMTIRPMTEVTRLAEELTGVKGIVEALRARTHEFSNKLHAIAGLLQLGSFEEATKFVSGVAQEEETLLSCLLSNFRVNAVTGLLIGKASEAEEKRIRFRIDPQSYLFSVPDSFDEHACVIVLGNLIENAFDAAKDFAKDPEVVVSIKQSETSIMFEVKDNGPGIRLHQDVQNMIFDPGYTTKQNGTGYGLVNVKNRVELARGEISFSCNEEGTRFRVTIPYDVLSDK